MKKPFFVTFELAYIFSSSGIDGDFRHFICDEVHNVYTNFQLYANYSKVK